MKKILLLSTSNPNKTSGIIALDLYTGLKEKGFQVQLIVENYDKYEKGITCVKSYYKHLIEKFFRKIKNGIKKVFSINNLKLVKDKYHFDSLDLSKKEYKTKTILKKLQFKPDIIIVLFSQYFISYKNLFELQKQIGAPIIWQLADMYPFTGGCHYSWDCIGYTEFCQFCPAFVNKENIKILNPNLRLNENLEYANKTNITVVIGSDWLIDRAKISTMFKNKRIEKIFLSIDSEKFIPYDFNKIKRLKSEYFVPLSSKIILVMAKSLSHERKGIKIILDSFKKLSNKTIRDKKLFLLIVGGEYEKIKSYIPDNVPHKQIDFVEREELPQIYNISDIFISASLQEVGPYTIGESLLCETPVVSFNSGYANDFVITGETGFLVLENNEQQLNVGLMELLNLPEKEFEKMKKKSRLLTLSKVSKKIQIENYVNLINSLTHD